MSLLFCQIDRKKKFLAIKTIEKYLSSVFAIFSSQERENWIFFKGLGCLGLVFEGEIGKEEKKDFFSQTIVVADKKFAIVKFSLFNNKEKTRKIFQKIKSQIKKRTHLLILEQTAKWEIYKGKDWLKKYAPPKKTIKNNLFFPQGTISPYFGFGKDEKNFYQKDKRGINFAQKFKKRDYDRILSFYYSQFLDENNLKGLANFQETGLRHFTVGLYEKEGKPYFFAIRSATIEGKPAFLKRKNFLYLSSSKYFLQKFLKKPSFLIKDFAKGKIFEQPL